MNAHAHRARARAAGGQRLSGDLGHGLRRERHRAADDLLRHLRAASATAIGSAASTMRAASARAAASATAASAKPSARPVSNPSRRAASRAATRLGADRLGLGPRPRQQRLGLGARVERSLGDDVANPLTTRPTLPIPPASRGERQQPPPQRRRQPLRDGLDGVAPLGASATASARAPRCAARSAGFSPATRSTRRRAASRASGGSGLGRRLDQRLRQPVAQVGRGPRATTSPGAPRRETPSVYAPRSSTASSTAASGRARSGARLGPGRRARAGQRHQPCEDLPAEARRAGGRGGSRSSRRLSPRSFSSASAIRRTSAGNTVTDGLHDRRRFGRQPLAQPAGVDALDARRHRGAHERQQLGQRRRPGRAASLPPSASSAPDRAPPVAPGEPRGERLGRHPGEQGPEDQPLLRERKRRHRRMHGRIIGCRRPACNPGPGWVRPRPTCARAPGRVHLAARK